MCLGLHRSDHKSSHGGCDLLFIHIAYREGGSCLDPSREQAPLRPSSRTDVTHPHELQPLGPQEPLAAQVVNGDCVVLVPEVVGHVHPAVTPPLKKSPNHSQVVEPARAHPR